ncbi:ead/Ea22-like family protein [Salmonella enterica]|nr:ead/Ea22-like family protein [Salmonella enterica]ECF5161476.1 ead/Ea22-like family protein [Salmonella enterica]ECS0382333.1 ead/Ea22-like family protein [Salmonella enterica]ECV2119345.1 ead/Ea22-like family protein [Salmonella enterica]ECW1726836.1 ead/Ea22-like family protein [Salmonella enterica]
MTIDKQALLVSKAKASVFTMRYISQFEASDIDSDDIDLRFEVDGTETGTTVSIVDECGHAAQIITALLDENIQLQRGKDALEAVALALRDDMRDAREQLEAAERRIAEFERSETQLISERDDAESALNDAYKAVMGHAPEWSNWFSFENAIDEIELACELWRNQTDDVIQFRQRIAELEARAVNLPKRSVGEVMHLSGFSRDYAEGWCAGNDNAIHEIRTAGIKVKGE